MARVFGDLAHPLISPLSSVADRRVDRKPGTNAASSSKQLTETRSKSKDSQGENEEYTEQQKKRYADNYGQRCLRDREEWRRW